MQRVEKLEGSVTDLSLVYSETLDLIQGISEINKPTTKHNMLVAKIIQPASRKSVHIRSLLEGSISGGSIRQSSKEIQRYNKKHPNIPTAMPRYFIHMPV